MTIEDEINKFCGLRNFGNTCYINAVIQCLNVTPSILKGLTDDIEHERDLEMFAIIRKYLEENNDLDNDDTQEDDDQSDIKKDDIKKFHLYLNFKKLIIEFNKKQGEVLNPFDFIIACKNIADANPCLEHLFSGMQNDAQEFYTFLLDILHESKINDTEIQTKFNSIEECGNSNSDKIYFEAEKRFKEHYNKKHSWLIDEFFFQNICITKCSSCSYYSLNYDPSSNLIVPIPKLANSKEKLTLIDSLDHHFGKEILDGKSQWKCDECNNVEQNYKQYRLFNSPNTLVISIKRFEYNPMFGNFVKNNAMIEIPETLNISNYKLFNKDTNNMYKLYAIVNHIGNMNGGHYYAYCRNNIQTNIKKGCNQWLEYNDNCISQINGDIITPHAYMLFYQLIN